MGVKPALNQRQIVAVDQRHEKSRIGFPLLRLTMSILGTEPVGRVELPPAHEGSQHPSLANGRGVDGRRVAVQHSKVRQLARHQGALDPFLEAAVGPTPACMR